MTTTPTTPTTFWLADGYDRSKTSTKHEFRPMTVEEAKLLGYNDHPEIIANDGTARVVKVNGRIRTWKRDPGRVEVPVKYGMYECASLRSRDDGTMERLIVRM